MLCVWSKLCYCISLTRLPITMARLIQVSSLWKLHFDLFLLLYSCTLKTRILQNCFGESCYKVIVFFCNISSLVEYVDLKVMAQWVSKCVSCCSFIDCFCTCLLLRTAPGMFLLWGSLKSSFLMRSIVHLQFSRFSKQLAIALQ